MRWFALLAALSTVLTVTPATGMNCGGLSTQQQVAGAELIFVGNVVRVEREFLTHELDELVARVDRGEQYGLQQMVNSHYIFSVTDVWKGKVRKLQRVSQPMFSSISADLDKGGPFTVFAKRSEGFVYTDACTGTTGRTLDLSEFGLLATEPLPGWDMNFSSGQQARRLALNLVFSMVAVHLTLALSRRRAAGSRP